MKNKNCVKVVVYMHDTHHALCPKRAQKKPSPDFFLART
jgi:hypothetical protein